MVKRKYYGSKKKPVNITLSEEALELVSKSGIDNLSGYFEDVIRENLSDRDHLIKKYMAELNTLQEKFRSLNIEFNIVFKNKSIKIEISKIKPKQITEIPKETTME